LAYLASAFYPSPVRDAAVVSVDGCVILPVQRGAADATLPYRSTTACCFRTSLGVFYQAMTQYLGIPHYGDEYKLMGLAAYGNPSCSPEVEKLLTLRDDGSFALNLKYFRHHHMLML
jgi:carbamoyltransferase